MKRYGLDPDQIGLERFLELTRHRKMLPGRLELHEKMDARFASLRQAGVSTLGELIRKLSAPSKRKAMACETGLPERYLILLKREAGSYLARPFQLSDFPGIPYEYTEVLKSRQLSNTRDYFEQVQTREQKVHISRETGIPLSRIGELQVLCDLSRITGVGGVFARMVYESGIRSVREFSKTGAEEHHLLYQAWRTRHADAAPHFSVDDIRYCIEYAKVVAEFDNETGDESCPGKIC